MRRLKAFVFGGLFTVVMIGLLLFVIAATGAVNVEATSHPGPIERTLFSWARDRSIATHAGAPPIAIAHNDAARAIGLDHYRENCIPCHGAPGVERGEPGQGLFPPAPALTGARIQRRPDRELYWIIEHGIRNTGMPGFGPTHNPKELAALVAFVRHLPVLTAEEKAKLEQAEEQEEQHHQQQQQGERH